MVEMPRTARRQRRGGFTLGEVASERDEAKKPLSHKLRGGATTLGGFLFYTVYILYIYIYILILYVDPQLLFLLGLYVCIYCLLL